MKTPTSMPPQPPIALEKHGVFESDSVTGRESTVFDPALERLVWRKMDKWVLPIVSMFYFLSFLDRTNLGAARVAGLQSDLKMTDKQYSIALTLTYVPYIIAELPSNLLLKAIGPNVMLPTMLTFWGIVTILEGTVTTYKGLLACRFFLGLFEGGVFPGLVLYLSYFYPRQQLQWRVSAFFSTASISGAFSGLLAFAIINMDGIGGRPGWAWIFILEGIFTFLFGLCSYFLLPRSPSHTRFLNENERTYVVERLRESGSTACDESADGFSWREIRQAFRLPQVWMLAVILFFNGAILQGLAYFAPSIVQTLGYTAARAQLMSVPPFASSYVVAMVAAFISDRYHCRGFVTMFSSTLCIVGFSMFLGSSSQRVKYGSLFLSISGTYCAAATLSTWSANNAAPHIRRATAIAFGFILTNAGGILVTWLLGSLSPPPLYTKATTTLLVFSVLMLLISAANTYYLRSQNRRKAVIRAVMSRGDEKHGLGDRTMKRSASPYGRTKAMKVSTSDIDTLDAID